MAIHLSGLPGDVGRAGDGGGGGGVGEGGEEGPVVGGVFGQPGFEAGTGALGLAAFHARSLEAGSTYSRSVLGESRSLRAARFRSQAAAWAEARNEREVSRMNASPC